MKTALHLALRVLIVGVVVLTAAGCNTFHGLGRDVEALGNFLQEEATDDGW